MSTRWQDYPSQDAEPSPGDTLLIRDLSDTTDNADGSVKQVAYSVLTGSLQDQITALGPLATLDVDLPDDVTLCLDGTGAFSAKVPNTAVTPGAYTNANITVTQDGRITSAASGSGGGGLANEEDDSATAITADDTIASEHHALTGTSAITITLADTNVTDGTQIAFSKRTDQTVTVDVAANARYLLPGDTNASATAAVSDAVWGTPSGNNVTITSAGGNLIDYAAGDLFRIRNHSNAANNGDYIATGTPTTSSLPATKLTGSAPAAAASEAVDLDTLQRQASFELTGYMECEVILDNGTVVWSVVGKTNHNQTIDGDLDVAGALTVGTFGLTNLSLAGTLGVTGVSTFTGAANFDSTADFDGAVDISAALTLSGSASANFAGLSVFGNLAKVESDGTLAATQSGQVIVTNANVIIPTTAGFNCTLIAGGAHTVTFNSTTSAAMAAGDIMSIIVQSSTIIHAVKTLSADKVAFA